MICPRCNTSLPNHLSCCPHCGLSLQPNGLNGSGLSSETNNQTTPNRGYYTRPYTNQNDPNLQQGNSYYQGNWANRNNYQHQQVPQMYPDQANWGKAPSRKGSVLAIGIAVLTTVVVMLLIFIPLYSRETAVTEKNNSNTTTATTTTKKNIKSGKKTTKSSTKEIPKSVHGKIANGSSKTSSKTNKDVDIDDTSDNKMVKSKTEVAVNDTVIFEGYDVIVELKSMHGRTLDFYIENNSEKNLTSSMHAFAVNGVMADNNQYDMYKSIAAHSKANLSFEIPKTLESGYSVDEIKQMKFLIWFYDNDESFKSFDTGILTVETNLADGNLDNSLGEEELLNENNISYKLVEKTEEQFVVSINNNSDTMGVFSGKNVVVNGFTLDTTYNLDILDKIVFPGCSYPMTFEYNWSASDDFKGTNGINKIENVTFNFEVQPNDDYSQEYSTTQMTITY